MHLDIHEYGMCKQSIQQEVAQKHLNFSNETKTKREASSLHPRCLSINIGILHFSSIKIFTKIFTECFSSFFPLKLKERKALGFCPAKASLSKGTAKMEFEVKSLNLNF